MSGPYKIVLFDDCCNVYFSLDTGEVWDGKATPSATGFDDWTDMAMAANDGDYSTVALFDKIVSADYDGTKFDLSRGGVIVGNIANGDATITRGVINSYSTGTINVNFNEALSGAIAYGGNKILLPILYTDTDSLASNYPKISEDGGATWADLTGAPVGAQWTRACFSGGASTMYMHRLSTGIYKSEDGGSTWDLLSASPALAPAGGQTAVGQDENSLRLRCSQNGLVVATMDWYGSFNVSTDGGTAWASTDFIAEIGGGITWTSAGLAADFGMSLDGSVIVVSLYTNISGAISAHVWLSTNFASTWQPLSPPSASTLGAYNVNVTPDGAAIVVTYDNGAFVGKIDVSTDQGITWATKTFSIADFSEGFGGAFVSSYIFPQSAQSATTPPPLGDPGGGDLIGATYRRVSAFATETPAFVGWHRHDLGHARTLTSIGVSGDTGGLLDNLDMVTTDGTNTYVEGFTQIFDEDDDLTDGWFLDGALVPDSAYEDTVSGTTGVRFTGLWYLRLQFVTVCAFGLDLGDFTVDTDGTLFVPYGSGTAPGLFDYTSAGAGAYLFTAAYITANVQTAAPRNGGVFISSGYMPVVVGYTFVSDGQTLRPAAQEQVGTRTGSPFGQKRRSHYVKALLRNTIGLQFGTDFGTTLQAAKLADDAGTQPTPTQPYSGLWRETLNDDYTFDSMLSWRIVRPYPASVVSIGASVEGQDA